MWQPINPSSWVVPMASPGTYTNPVGSTEDQNTPLLPFFWSTSGNPWNSNYVYYTKNFGYAYIETQDWNYNSQSAYQASIKSAINRLYGSTAPANQVQTKVKRRMCSIFF
jgi:tyrosinase